MSLSAGRAAFVTTAAILGLACLGVAAGRWWWWDLQVRTTLDNAVALGRENTSKAAQQIDNQLGQVPAAVQQLVEELRQGTLRPEGVPARLRDVAVSGPAAGYGVAFEALAAGPSRRLFAPYVERGDREPVREVDFATLYPYNEYRYGWFCDTLLDGAGWIEAELFPDSDEVVALYSVPFRLPGAARYSGVAFAAVRLETISDALETINVGESGYSFVISRDGQYLVHPRGELVRQSQTLFETAWAGGNTGLHKVAVRATQGETLFTEAPDEVTGRDNWIFAEPLKTTGWSVFAVFFRDEFRPDSDEERRHLFIIIVFGLAGLWLLVASTAGARLRDPARFSWACSNSLAAVLILAMTFCWYVAVHYPDTRPTDQNVVFDQGSAYEFLDTLGVDDRMEGVDDIAVIPTGVYVRSIAFQSGSEVAVSGFVWQRYERGRHEHIQRGFSLPETFDPGQSHIEEIFRIRTELEERVGWYFAARFRQVFDTGKFPFDRQSIWVRLAPPGVSRNIVFVPDFEAYTLMNPNLRPGVADTLLLSGWDLIGSRFDYRLHSYNTTLGLPVAQNRERSPELYFNVDVERQFVGPFVAYMVPMGVTAGMLFALLLISSRREASQGLLGFSAAEIVLGCAALFFVASFQHIAMRESLDVDGLIYFEYFFFVLYVLLMLVSVNAILFASDTDLPMIEYADNLIPKIMFWPAGLLTLFAITLAHFY